jgi:hypothetical protein
MKGGFVAYYGGFRANCDNTFVSLKQFIHHKNYEYV